VWGASLRSGFAKPDKDLGPLDVHVGASVAIGDDVGHLRELDHPVRALYIGGMGARGRNFYNDLARVSRPWPSAPWPKTTRAGCG
jgi:hypothetical protein